MANALTPHLDKIAAAISNPKCSQDVSLLEEAMEHYEAWVRGVQALKSTGRQRVEDMVALLNRYKDTLEVELVMKRGSDFLRRQKGQLKLDNSVIEEFLIQLVDPDVLGGVETSRLLVGPHNTFMSLAFRPRDLAGLGGKPEVLLKTKDQDFVVGTRIFYKFAPSAEYGPTDTADGSLVLAVLAAECKINLDKTMFQEAAGTASRLKQGCPGARYYVLVEYLDMEPEDCRLTDIDNVFLLRKAKRLPANKRGVVEEVERIHKEHPIDSEVVWRFVDGLRAFMQSAWYDPEEVLKRGSFN